MPHFDKTIHLSEAELWPRLASLPGSFFLRDENRSFVGALPLETKRDLDPSPFPSAPLDPELRDWPEWVGVLPYEAFRHLEGRGRGRGADSRAQPIISSAIWKRYGAVAEVKSGILQVRGRSRSDVEALSEALQTAVSKRDIVAPSLTWASAPEDGRRHKRRVEIALKRIGRGELYQVNLARRFDFVARGHAITLLKSLGPLAEAPFSAALDLGEVQVVSTSPELCLDYQPGGEVLTRPIKGTRPRSNDPGEDARLRAELDGSEKERAELAMVIDIERNDLGRLAVPGSVEMIQPPTVVSYPTVHHREATIRAQLLPGCSRSTLLEAMLPSGSVTGAPKVAAMDLIAELEAERRGLYTGALGYLTHGGGARLSMAIRVLSLRGGIAHYFAGGGIVADSDPEQELQETTWKAEQLKGLVPFG